MAALMMNVNSPRLRMISGKLNSFTSGFTKVLMTPNSRATRTTLSRRVPNPSASLPMAMPGTTRAATHRAMPLTTVFRKNWRMGPASHPRGVPPCTGASGRVATRSRSGRRHG